MKPNHNYPETICWNCKCATGDPKHPCLWAQDGIPRNDWEAVKGRLIYFPEKSNKAPLQSWVVLKCPVYEQDKEWLDYNDIIKALAKMFEVTEVTIYSNVKRYCRKYEEVTGKKIPMWITTRNLKGENL